MEKENQDGRRTLGYLKWQIRVGIAVGTETF